jgi:hypothetical protein
MRSPNHQQRFTLAGKPAVAYTLAEDTTPTDHKLWDSVAVYTLDKQHPAYDLRSSATRF